MKKTVYLFLVASFFFAACGSTEKNSKSTLKTQIEAKKSELSALKKQLSAMPDSSKEDNSIVVKTREMKLHNVAHTFVATGAAEAVQSAFVSSEMNGQIKIVHVSEGQYVRKGTLLVSLNAAVIKSSIGEIKSALNLATILFNKQDTLWNLKKVGKEMDFLSAKNQKEGLEAKLKTLYAQLEMSKVRAPFSGIVDEIMGKPGELASPGRMLIQFVNLSSMKIKADVSENYLPSIHKGDKVEVIFPAYPNKVISTKITRIGNVINPANRTFKIELLINNANKTIKPNMVANIKVTDYQAPNLTVPSIIVKNDSKGQYVYLVKEGKAKKVYVKTSLAIDSEIIIKEGLAEGDQVITKGYNLVSEGVTIRR